MAKQTGTYLDRILADTAAALAMRTDLPSAPPVEIPRTRGFARALAQSGVSLIAEVKKASPSKGIIRADFHPAEIARCYERAGARAISVLTDEKHFQGQLPYLDQVRAVTSIPLLRKDFIIHPAQILEAVGRADAVLLIVAALSVHDLREFHTLAAACGLDVLMEVHDREELEIALAVGARIIGINNRNLRTFAVDLQTTFDLLPAIPTDRLIVSESGITTHAEIGRLEEAGVGAVLVGEALMRCADIEGAVRELLEGEGR